MRVIGGSLRGRKLAAIRGHSIRPTADRVREALFNILGRRVIDAQVLDLFAGTGALGIEALSRGAQRAVFVDQSASAVQLIRKNIALCRLEARSEVICLDVLGKLRSLRGRGGTFDLIFLDPPYHSGMIQPALEQLAQHRLASQEALVVAEHGLSEDIGPQPPSWDLVDRRRYGQTQLSFLTPAIEPAAPGSGVET